MESEKGELNHLVQKEAWEVHPKVTCARVNQHFILQTALNFKHLPQTMYFMPVSYHDLDE
jgi:hypothetical protein